eukprot:7820428-Karenia_brevis.AAC.1
MMTMMMMLMMLMIMMMRMMAIIAVNARPVDAALRNSNMKTIAQSKKETGVFLPALIAGTDCPSSSPTTELN